MLISPFYNCKPDLAVIVRRYDEGPKPFGLHLLYSPEQIIGADPIFPYVPRSVGLYEDERQARVAMRRCGPFRYGIRYGLVSPGFRKFISDQIAPIEFQPLLDAKDARVMDRFRIWANTASMLYDPAFDRYRDAIKAKIT